MKFRIERDEFNEALSDVSRVATARTSAMPALAGVELSVTGDTLTLSCTDKELSIQTTLTVLEGESLIVEAGRNRSSVLCYAANDFPKILQASAPEGKMSAAVFGDALRQVVRAASADASRLALTGVLISNQPEGLTFVATDSYRLAVRQISGTALAGESSVIIPARALGELLRLIKDHDTITYRLASDRATFGVGNTTLSTALLAVQFPNYKQLIQPSYPNKLSVNREALLDAVRRSKVFARDNIPVRLTQSSGALKLSVHTQDTGETIE
ncbi:MAG: DNA polymerase III subunit beta, partial [Actinobacteria bacterium]|nr:DNA polymerase III subunit beta [Actinomycetota bacterium]